MKKKYNPTSQAAYKQVTDEMLSDHHLKIVAALSKLKAANYEQIALSAKMDRHQIGRRLSELELKGIVWKPGGMSKTSSGRLAMNYQLTSETTIHPAPVEKAMKGKSVSDYTKKINTIIQSSMF